MRKNFSWLPLWVVPVLILFSVVTVWVRLCVVRLSYTINQTERSTRNLHQDLEKLEMKLANARSPSRLEILARDKFGLAQPRADQIVHLK